MVMEILGGEFEDSLFSESRERNAAKSEAYTAKQCEAQWFIGEVCSKDCTEVLTSKKFCGDLAYRQKDFQKALQEYTNCFLLLNSNNIAMRRDVQESQARCLCHLGRHREALEVAQELRNGSANTDQLTTVLNLQVAIHRSVRNVQKVIPCLQQLITLNPFNPWHWKTLAEAYLDLLQAACSSSVSDSDCKEKGDQDEHGKAVDNLSFGLCRAQRGNILSPKEQSSSENSASSTPSQNCFDSGSSEQITAKMAFSNSSENGKILLPSESCAKEEFKELWKKSCASFLRTRLLLQLVQSQQSSFILENNLKAQISIEEKLKGFGLKEDTLIRITEIIGEDLSQERLREEMQAEGKVGVTAALATFAIPSEAEFECRWFQTIMDHLEHTALY